MNAITIVYNGAGLLLEKSTWMMQARVEQIAEDKLGMIIPER